MVRDFNHDKHVLKNCYKHLKKRYNEINTLLREKGFSWDNAREMVAAKDHVGDAYISAHPDVRSYRVKTVPNFHKLCIIYGHGSKRRYSLLACAVGVSSTDLLEGDALFSGGTIEFNQVNNYKYRAGQAKYADAVHIRQRRRTETSHLIGCEVQDCYWFGSALLYLHEECDQCVVHRDDKTSNIMLVSRFNANLRDFGLARLMDHELDIKTNRLAGTPRVPEYATTGKASKGYLFGLTSLYHQ